MDYLVYSLQPRGQVSQVSYLTDADSIMVPTSTKVNWTTYYWSPILLSNLTVLGEVGKYVPMSRGRVRNIGVTSNSIVLDLTGAIGGETVNIAYAILEQQTWRMQTASCKTNSDDGKVQMTIYNVNLAANCNQSFKEKEIQSQWK